jgi:tRNA (guanosine-2'-O-)-methyltransferase
LVDGTFIIPQVGIIKSLNISVACAVTLYEAFRQKQIAGHYDEPGLGEEQLKNLKEEWGIEK